MKKIFLSLFCLATLTALQGQSSEHVKPNSIKLVEPEQTDTTQFTLDTVLCKALFSEVLGYSPQTAEILVVTKTQGKNTTISRYITARDYIEFDKRTVFWNIIPVGKVTAKK